MTREDVQAADGVAAFDDLGRRMSEGGPVALPGPERRAQGQRRMTRLVTHDPEGVVGGDGHLLLLAAVDEASARELLWASLSCVPQGVQTRAKWMTSGQDWAFEIMLAAGLALAPRRPRCTRAEVGNLRHYLPNGAYL